jgi:hypothetical protein
VGLVVECRTGGEGRRCVGVGLSRSMEGVAILTDLSQLQLAGPLDLERLHAWPRGLSTRSKHGSEQGLSPLERI